MKYNQSSSKMNEMFREMMTPPSEDDPRQKCQLNLRI